MSDSPSPSASSSVGAHSKDSQTLRHVEKDVLIPKKMRAKAMVLCQDLVKGTLCTKEAGYETTYLYIYDDEVEQYMYMYTVMCISCRV